MGLSLDFAFWHSEVLCCSFPIGGPHVSGGKTLSALEPTGPPGQPLVASTPAIHMSLLDMRRSVAELRLQLQQMRQLQVQTVFLTGDIICLVAQSLVSPPPTPLPHTPSQGSFYHCLHELKT